MGVDVLMEKKKRSSESPNVIWQLQQFTWSTWHEVNFLHSSACAAVFWISDWGSAENTPVFWLLLGSTCTVWRLVFFLHSLSQQAGHGVGKKLGWDTTKTADLNWPKEYYMDIMSTIKILSRRQLWEVATAQRLAGHQAAGGRCWWPCITSGIFLFVSLFPSLINYL